MRNWESTVAKMKKSLSKGEAWDAIALTTTARSQALTTPTARRGVQHPKTWTRIYGNVVSASNHLTSGQRWEFTSAQCKPTNHSTADIARCPSPIRPHYEAMSEHIPTTACSSADTVGADSQEQRRWPITFARTQAKNRSLVKNAGKIFHKRRNSADIKEFLVIAYKIMTSPQKSSIDREILYSRGQIYTG